MRPAAVRPRKTLAPLETAAPVLELRDELVNVSRMRVKDAYPEPVPDGLVLGEVALDEWLPLEDGVGALDKGPGVPLDKVVPLDEGVLLDDPSVEDGAGDTVLRLTPCGTQYIRG